MLHIVNALLSSMVIAIVSRLLFIFISLVEMFDLMCIVTPPLALSTVFLFLLNPLKFLRWAVKLSLKLVS